MSPDTRSPWSMLLVVLLVLCVAAGAVWYRLAREGRVPPPGRWLVGGALLLLLVLPFALAGLYRALMRETEDAAALRRRATEEPPSDALRDYSREYPLVFRPEWRGLLMNGGMTLMTLVVAVLQTDQFSVRDRVLVFVVIASLTALILGLLWSRRLTISWSGVTLKEVRRERFWAWDQIHAVALLERRGRRRPALRLQTTNGQGELVSLGGIDFAREDLLFDVLLARIQRLEVEVAGATVVLTPRSGGDARAALAQLLDAEDAADEPLAMEAGENGADPVPRAVVRAEPGVRH